MKQPNLATLAIKLLKQPNLTTVQTMDKASNLVRRYEMGTEQRTANYSKAIENPAELRQFDNNMYDILHRYVDIYGDKQ